jgi:hypothetical protein
VRLFGIVLVMVAALVAALAAGVVARLTVASSEWKVHALSSGYLGTAWQRMRADVRMSTSIVQTPGGGYLLTVTDTVSPGLPGLVILRCREYSVFEAALVFRDAPPPSSGPCPQPSGPWMDAYTGTGSLVSGVGLGLLRLPSARLCHFQEAGRIAAIWLQDAPCDASPWPPAALLVTVEAEGRQAKVFWPVLWVRR